MSEDRFRYVEQEPPLTGEERRRDYGRQYNRWKYHTDPETRERAKATQRWHYHNNPVYRAMVKIRAKLAQIERVASGEAAEYERKRRAARRARQLAVAREYGATL